MEVIKYDDPLGVDIKKSVVSIGNYDGVHLGHQKILKTLISKSEKSGCKSIVLTFVPHPKKFFAKAADNTFLLTDFDEKVNLIKGFPVDYLIYFEFNKDFANITAEDFVKDILVKDLNIKEVIVGYNFNFGKDRAGNTDFLKEKGAQYDFEVTVIEPEKIGDEVISSSFIRDMVSSGNVKKAAKFLSRNYSVTGEVIRGHEMGKKAGFPFPTINLSTPGKLVPKEGVYSVLVKVGDKKLEGVANVGTQPTFGRDTYSIEAHIMDFDKDIYGEQVTIEFVDRLREVKKFKSMQDLTDQIKNDVEAAKASFEAASFT